MASYSLTAWRNVRDPLTQVTSFPLLGNPRQFFYPSRRSPILGVAFHIAVAYDDRVGEDTSAAAVNNYGRTTTRPASWTVCTDKDSVDPALPHTYTAFAQGVVGFNFNAPLLSVEMGTYSSNWNAKDKNDVARFVRMNAAWAAPFVMAYRIPKRVINNRNEVQRLINAGQKVGFVSHGKLASDRTDPGIVPNGSAFPWNSPGYDTYPWALFFKFLEEEIDIRIRTHGDVYNYKSSGQYTPPEVSVPEDINQGFPDSHIEWVQVVLALAGLYDGEIDKLKGSKTTDAIIEVQKNYNLVEDGRPGPKTSKVLEIIMNEVVDAITKAVTKSVTESLMRTQVHLTDGQRSALNTKAESLSVARMLGIIAHRSAYAFRVSVENRDLLQKIAPK